MIPTRRLLINVGEKVCVSDTMALRLNWLSFRSCPTVGSVNMLLAAVWCSADVYRTNIELFSLRR